MTTNNGMLIGRMLKLPEAGAETFFLWGPRQTGKTTLLRHRYPDASPREQYLRVAIVTLGLEMAARAYPEIVTLGLS